MINPMRALSGLILFLLLAHPALSQQDAILQPDSTSRQDSTVHVNSIVEMTQLYFENIPIEKAHLHFDKPYYAVGDTMWFKGYLSRNLYHYDPSSVMYVEVLTARDSLIQTLKIPLKDDVGHGQLVLDQQWFTQGNYRVRAYTKWMVNFGPEYFFNKVIPLGDVLNHSLHSQIKFEEVGGGRDARIRATMQFSNRAGQVLANRRVNWQAVSNFEALASGRGETDAMGNITLDIQARDRDRLASSTLNLSVQDPQTSAGLLVSNVPLRSALWDVDVQFFPEGGDLLADVAKKVAFKVVGSDGMGVSAKGEVKDSQGQVVSSFETLHAGMGVFHLLPMTGERYQAHLTFENGQTRQVDLPEVKTEGINLVYVRDLGDQVQMAVVANPKFVEKFREQPFSIMAQADGIIGYAAQVNLRNESALINLPKERFPTGLAQITLFSPSGVPLSERLFFVESLKPLEIQLTTDKPQYAAKDPVSLQMTVLNNDSTFTGNYSISVVDELKVPYDDNNSTTILSNLLLTSHLKGYIEKPHYYFNPANDNRQEALDILLMTQGYKRFNYSDLLAQQYPDILFMPENGIELSGTLRLTNGRPVENGGLLLSIPDHGVRRDVYTDAQGRFTFSGLVFTDSARVTINARGNDNYRDMVIHMDQTMYPAVDQNTYWADGELNIDLLMEPYLSNSRRVFRTDVLIDEVQVTATPSMSRSYKEYPSLSGLNMADHQINAERLQGCNNLLICLQTMLTGITYDSRDQLFYISRDYNMGGRIPVQFFVNGMPMDVVALGGIMPHEVEGIEIFLRDELGVVSRTYQNNGVVSIYTTKPAEAGPRMSLAEIERLLPKANVVDLNPLGYVRQYSFYVPKYDTPESKNVNDLRSTIYWNPQVITDENGEITLNFYNGDGRGSYRIIVEGMDATGNFGRAVHRYEVR